MKSLHAKIGKLTLANDFCPARSQKRDHDLSIVRQTKAFGVARSSVYDKPPPVSAEALKLMRRLDELHSRRVLSHRVSITIEAGFCIEALEEALAKHGKPEIFNADQGSQLTDLDFTRVLLDAKIAPWTARAPGRDRHNYFLSLEG